MPEFFILIGTNILIFIFKLAKRTRVPTQYDGPILIVKLGTIIIFQQSIFWIQMYSIVAIEIKVYWSNEIKCDSWVKSSSLH